MKHYHQSDSHLSAAQSCTELVVDRTKVDEPTDNAAGCANPSAMNPPMVMASANTEEEEKEWVSAQHIGPSGGHFLVQSCAELPTQRLETDEPHSAPPPPHIYRSDDVDVSRTKETPTDQQSSIVSLDMGDTDSDGALAHRSDSRLMVQSCAELSTQRPEEDNNDPDGHSPPADPDAEQSNQNSTVPVITFA